MTQQHSKEITASGVKHFVVADEYFYSQKKKENHRFSTQPIEVLDRSHETLINFIKANPEFKGASNLKFVDKKFVLYNNELYFKEPENASKPIFLGVKYTFNEVIKIIPQSQIERNQWESLIENGKEKEFLFTPTGKLMWFNTRCCIDTSIL